jgi:RiboL-PSP-HEPN
MVSYAERIGDYCDTRVSTLGRIKARSLGADALTLTALKVLVYSQLEGGIKDLASCVLRDVNNRRLTTGDINPKLLQWRNANEIQVFKSMVTFEMVAAISPFGHALNKRVKVRGINRKSEMNQMGWETIRKVYDGLGLDHSFVGTLRNEISDIVEDRNHAAHYGVVPPFGTTMMEKQVRENANVVEKVLTDFGIRLLPFFEQNMHRR